MNNFKDIRWKQRFDNFEKSYKTMAKYIDKPIETELERAGMIQLFEMTFELSWKVMKDYLESQGIVAKTPRDTIKHASQIDLIDDAYTWIDGLVDRNLTANTYDEKKAKKMVEDIKMKYFPELKKLYQKLYREK